MARFRIHAEYPVYVGGGCIPYTIYFVQKLEEGFFCDKWVDIKGFESRQKAEAMKDLPRWKKCGFPVGTDNPFPRYLVRKGGEHYSLTSTILKCDEYILLSELAKLPGFKEDRV